MNEFVPQPWEFIIVALAAYRIWRLLAEDSILDWPRRKLLRLGDWQVEGDPVPANYREKLGSFVGCPACFGFWIALAWYATWYYWPVEVTGVAVPFALSAAVIFMRSQLDPPD